MKKFNRPSVFLKLSPDAVDSLSCLGQEYYPAVSVLILLISLSSHQEITIIDQMKISHLLHMSRRKVHKALCVILADKYLVGAKIHHSSINTYVINSYLVWEYKDSEYRSPIIDIFNDLPTGHQLAHKNHPNLYKNLKKYRRKSMQSVIQTNVTYNDIKRQRVDSHLQLIRSANLDKHIVTRDRNVKSNFLFYIHSIGLTKEQLIIAEYLIDKIDPVTYTLCATDKSLYKMMHKNLFSVGYRSVVKTIKILKDEGLITKSKIPHDKKHREIFIVNRRLINQSKHSKLTFNHKAVNQNNKLMNKRLSGKE